MKYIKQFGSFWYHFIVGDDWRIALGVVLGLGLTKYLVTIHHLQAWWLLPIFVSMTLGVSVYTASRRP